MIVVFIEKKTAYEMRISDWSADVCSSDLAVVRGMDVAHFEAGAFAGQAARAQCGNTALVRDFRQGVGLVHELRQLARTEELLDGSRDRLGVDRKSVE